MKVFMIFAIIITVVVLLCVLIFKNGGATYREEKAIKDSQKNNTPDVVENQEHSLCKTQQIAKTYKNCGTFLLIASLVLAFIAGVIYISMQDCAELAAKATYSWEIKEAGDCVASNLSKKEWSSYLFQLSTTLFFIGCPFLYIASQIAKIKE